MIYVEGGSITVGEKTEIGYYAQEHELLDNDKIIADYAKSIAFLTANLSEDEKKTFIYDAVNLANADNEYTENEYISIEALARNWNVYFE